MRTLILLCVISTGVAAAGPLPAPVAIKSVTAPSETKDDPIWKVVTSTDGHWCQGKRGVGVGEPLTITFAAPAPISSVELDTSNDGNTIASAEVTADGKPFKAPTVDVKLGANSTGHSTTLVKLSGAPVTTIVVKLVTSKQGNPDVACTRSVALHTASKPEAAILFGIDAAAAGALWTDLEAAKSAFASCDKKALAGVAFPFTTSWYTEDMDGMKEKSSKFKSAAALATACKKKKLHGLDGMKLESPDVKSVNATQLDVSEDGSAWSVKLDAGHWRVQAINEGG